MILFFKSTSLHYLRHLKYLNFTAEKFVSMKQAALVTILFLVLMMLAYFFRKQSSQSSYFSTDNQDIYTQTSDIQNYKFYYSKIQDFYPVITQNNHQIVSYSGFDLCYNEDNEQADWVIYLHTLEKTNGNVSRKDNFREDKNILTKSALPSDYTNSGFDRGHLAPAADMKWSETAMDESFLMSNISPQKPAFNRGIWKKLEEKIRSWAIENDSIIVVTGPVFKDISGKIGLNQVSIPGYFFKVILDVSLPDIKAIAFLLRNEGSSRDIKEFAITVDSLERFTSYDFFFKTDRDFMEKVERELNLAAWGL